MYDQPYKLQGSGACAMRGEGEKSGRRQAWREEGAGLGDGGKVRRREGASEGKRGLVRELKGFADTERS